MAAFRLIGIDARGGDLDLSELQFWAQGQRVDAGASISCSLAPVAGDVSSLLDGNPATGCRWAATDVRAPGFWIQIDMAAAFVDEVFMRGALVAVRLAVVQPPPQQSFSAWPELVSGGAWFRNGQALAAILVASPAGAWGLDGAGSNQPDLVGSRHGTRTGGVISSEVITEGLSASFDPQGSGVIAMPADTLDANAFTVVIDVQTTTSDNLVFAEHGSDNKGWSLQIAGTSSAAVYGAVVGGIIVACGFGASGGLSMSSAKVNDGRPHRIVFGYSPQAGRRLYIDGVLDAKEYGPHGAPIYNTTQFNVGSRNGVVGLPAGSLLSAFAIFNRLLTPAEVVAICSDPRVTRTQSMQRLQSMSIQGSDPVPQGLQAIRVQRNAKLLDTEFGGDGRIFGSVARKGTPANAPLKRRVRLHRSRDGMLVRETWSKADGSYEFTEISGRYEYDVIAWDHELQLRSVVANNLTPEAM